jgi:hypothetical protein
MWIWIFFVIMKLNSLAKFPKSKKVVTKNEPKWAGRKCWDFGPSWPSGTWGLFQRPFSNFPLLFAA